MSKVGIRKIYLPESVQVAKKDTEIEISGPKGTLTLCVPKQISINQKENEIGVLRSGDDKQSKSFHGLYRKLIANMVQGVSEGFTKKLDFKGVGFRAEVKEGVLVLNVGFSHPVDYSIPSGIEIKVEKNVISVSGINKQEVGQVAAEIRAIKPVEPYKGKGIKYIDETPRRKLGKTAKTAIGGGQ